MPEISVLMSVYNAEKYLSLSIKSILNQTFLDFEFIIINDGSIDKSGIIIDEYSKIDSRVIPIHQDNKGLTKSLNIGLELAKGKYIARQDADDISYSERLEKQYDLLSLNDDIDVCFCWHNVIDENDNHIGSIIYSNLSERIKRNLISKRRNIYCHGSAMYKRDIVLINGGYDSNQKYAQDYELWIRLLKKGYKFSAVKNVLYNWRLNTNSISLTFYKEQNKSNIKIESPLYHHLQNLYFREQNRKRILINTKYLYNKKELSFKELLKCLITVQPLNYRWIFKYL